MNDKSSVLFGLARTGFATLREFYQHVVKTQLTLDNFVTKYKSCESDCMQLPN